MAKCGLVAGTEVVLSTWPGVFYMYVGRFCHLDCITTVKDADKNHHYCVAEIKMKVPSSVMGLVRARGLEARGVGSREGSLPAP